MIVPASLMDWTVAAGALATVAVFAALGYRAIGDPAEAPVEARRQEANRVEPRRAA
jgi:hypothetical protein